MNKAQAKDWLRVFGDLPDELRQPCDHGHRECSTVYRGSCLDDVIKVSVSEEEAPHV